MKTWWSIGWNGAHPIFRERERVSHGWISTSPWRIGFLATSRMSSTPRCLVCFKTIYFSQENMAITWGKPPIFQHPTHSTVLVMYPHAQISHLYPLFVGLFNSFRTSFSSLTILSQVMGFSRSRHNVYPERRLYSPHRFCFTYMSRIWWAKSPSFPMKLAVMTGGTIQRFTSSYNIT